MTEEIGNLRYQCRIQEKEILRLKEKVRVLEISNDFNEVQISKLRFVVSKLTGKWETLERLREIDRLTEDYDSNWMNNISKK